MSKQQAQKADPKKVQEAAEALIADSLLRIEGLNKNFEQGGKTLEIFQDLSLKVEAGEIIALVGPSGAGKSTLLQIAGLLDQPSSGRILMGNTMVGQLSDAERTGFRQNYVSFVYQFHHLLPEFSALENAAMPLIIAGKKHKEAKERARELLQAVGLGKRIDHRPGQLSGGEQQRVAIARALVPSPKLLLADEPTGNLDPDTSKEVFEILLNLTHKEGVGALIATHNLALAKQMDRIFELKDGKIFVT